LNETAAYVANFFGCVSERERERERESARERTIGGERFVVGCS